MQAVIAMAGKNPLALIVHDPASGRIVYKGQHTCEFYKAAQLLMGRHLVQIGRLNRIGVRRLVGPDDPGYLSVLVSRLVLTGILFSPIFDVDGSAGSIDDQSDRLALSHLTSDNPLT